jgi:hypothetical protein
MNQTLGERREELQRKIDVLVAEMVAEMPFWAMAIYYRNPMMPFWARAIYRIMMWVRRLWKNK